MIVQDEMHLAVRCAQCQRCSAVTVPYVVEKGKIQALKRDEWPKLCPHCGNVATMPTTEKDYESPGVATEAESAVRAAMRNSAGR